MSWTSSTIVPMSSHLGNKRAAYVSPIHSQHDSRRGPKTHQEATITQTYTATDPHAHSQRGRNTHKHRHTRKQHTERGAHRYANEEVKEEREGERKTERDGRRKQHTHTRSKSKGGQQHHTNNLIGGTRRPKETYEQTTPTCHVTNAIPNTQYK